MTPHYTYPAAVAAVHDGDTVRLVVDLGFHLDLTVTVRLDGINTRELAMPGGPEARDHLAALISDQPITLTSLGLDKYGRCLGRITLPDGRDVARIMITDGCAAPWDGRGEAPLPPWPL